MFVEVNDLTGSFLRATLRRAKVKRVKQLCYSQKGSLKITFYEVPGTELRFYTTHGVVFESTDVNGFQDMLQICDVTE